MRFTAWSRHLLLGAAMFVAACGGGSDSPNVNAAPLTTGASEAAIFAGSDFMLNGSATDPEGDALTYTWSTVNQPANAAPALGTPNAATTEVTGDLPAGNYLFHLTVSDGENTATVDVPVVLTSLTVRGEATQGRGTFDVANVDNIMIDADGGVWFGTDGNFSTNGTADSVYYLDLDPANASTNNPTFGQAFRIIGGPSDSEATGPAFNSDMKTFFFAVQHPGEGRDSAWPAERESFPLLADPADPLSSIVAASFLAPVGLENETNPPEDIAAYVKAMVAKLNTNPEWALENGVEFPLTNTTNDSVRAISGLRTNVVVRWLDPLTNATDDADMRFGANCDYVSYFGEGWDTNGNAPQFNGDPAAGWMWVNHEYISGGTPSFDAGTGTGSAPSGQHVTFAKFLAEAGILSMAPADVGLDASWDQDEVDTYVQWFKKQLGGTWMRIVQDPVSKRWAVDRGAANVRYDSTSNTLLNVVGRVTLANQQRDDDGNLLPQNIAVGLIGDCSGGTTPWGTIITAEENVQGYYGDLEDFWTSRQIFDLPNGAEAGGTIVPSIAPSTGGTYSRHSDANENKDRDAYGYLSEIDPGEAPDKSYVVGGDGSGHRKIGTMGRVRWEDVTVVTDADFKLIDGQPIVLYGANDRRGGRIYKFVSSANYTNGMSKAQIRALLDDGELYVAHWADLNNADGYTRNDGEDMLDTDGSASVRGNGRWIRMAIDSTDIAPNAGASTANNPSVTMLPAGSTVAQVLTNSTHNGIGSFANDNDVIKMLNTAANKLGVMELNRAEDLEWNAVGYGSHGPLLFVAFTKHGRPNALDANGVLNTDINTGSQIKSDARPDAIGHIFVMKEAGNAATSTTFEFWQVHRGSNASLPTK